MELAQRLKRDMVYLTWEWQTRIPTTTTTKSYKAQYKENALANKKTYEIISGVEREYILYGYKRNVRQLPKKESSSWSHAQSHTHIQDQISVRNVQIRGLAQGLYLSFFITLFLHKASMEVLVMKQQ